MRYLFRGMVRDNGQTVEGHVEATTEDGAINVLSQNGVVTESLVADPKALNLNEELPQAPQFADALESAFDSSSSQINFDELTERYHGKKVWVIDRDKIRRRVAQVVDAALALAAQHGDGSVQTRERVQNALSAMFSDNRNLASERNADSIAGLRFNGGNFAAPPMPQMPVPPVGSRVSQYLPNGSNGGNGHGSNGYAINEGHPGLEDQVARMAALVRQAESAMASIQAAARRGFGGGGGGGGGGRRFGPRAGKGEEQNSVLLEIFKSNLSLVRGMQSASTPAAAPAAN